MKGRTPRKKRTTTTDSTPFSFPDQSGRYVTKDEYVAAETPFALVDVEFQPTAGYNETPRWCATVAPNDGRPHELLTLGSNPKRDTQMQAAKAHIDAHGPIPNLRLVKIGNAYYFRSVDPPGS